MKKITLLIATILLVVTGSYAQVNLYSFAQSTGTYTAITGGTAVITCNACGTSYDSDSYVITLPTAFKFNGAYVTSVVMRVDGSLVVGSSSTSSSTAPIDATTTATGVVSALGMDLRNSTATGAIYELRWEDIGGEYVFQWTDAARWAQVNERLNFQIRINKTTGAVTIVYGTMSSIASSTTYQPQVGLRGTSNADYIARRLTATVPDATPSWDDTVAATASSNTVRFTAGSPAASPASGLTYTFTPPAGCGPAALAGGTMATTNYIVCTGVTPSTLTATGATSATYSGVTYQWEQSTNNGTNWANVTGGTGANSLSYVPPAFAGTSIQYRLKVSCSGSDVYSNVATLNPYTVIATQATALLANNSAPTTLSVSWTAGSGTRRLVYVSTSPITDPVSGSAIPAYTAATAYTSGQQIVYDGTGTSVTVTGLTCGTPYYVKVFEYNRCGSGPYDVYFNTTTGTNAITVTSPSTMPLPVTNNFAAFTGTNLSIMPGWYEANGTTNVSLIPVGGDSNWTKSTLLPTPTSKVNLYDDAYNAWMISPKMAITANSRLKFKAAITGYNVATAHATKMAGTDDKVNILVSTDGCGAVWTVIHTFNAANTTTLTNVLTDYTLPLNYIGQTIQIAFQGVDGPTDDTPDYDFHIGSILIEQTPQCDVPSGITIANLTKNSAGISWTAPTVGTPSGYQYVVSTTSTSPTGAGTPTSATSVTASPLLPSTQYYVYVRTVCGSDFSDWSVVKSFVTLCDYPELTSTTPGSVCGQGTVTLQAAAPAGSTIKWYANNTDFASIATGASFTTPLITATTNYYVSSGQSAPGNTVQAGAGATTAADYYNPLYSAWSNNHTQHIITAAELQAFGLSAGNINSISLNVTDPGTLPMIDLNIKIGTTTATNMSAFVANGAFATVFTSASYMPSTGINTFTFTAPFNWDGTSNLVVEFCHGNSASTATMNRTVTADATSYVSTIKHHFSAATASASACSSITGGTVASFSVRPVFYFNGVGLCMSPRTAVAATVTAPPTLTLSGNPAAICAGQTTAAVTITAGAASYNSFVWAPTTGVSGNSTTGWTFNPAVTTAYTLTATNTVSGCINTLPLTVTVNALPGAVTISPDPMAVCQGTSAAIVAQGAVINVNAIVGTGTTAPGATSWPNPFSAWYGGTKTQILFKASELTAQGLLPNNNINSLAFDFFASVASQCKDFTIKIGGTAVANLTSGFVDSSTFTTVYNADFTPTVGTTGFVGFTFTTPFMWTGGDIIVEVIHNAGNGGNGSGTRTNTTTTTYDSVYYGAKDNVTPAGVASLSAVATADFSAKGTTALRPNIRFSQNVNNAVTWAPVTNLFTDVAATIPYTGQNLATVYTKPTAAITYVATITNTAGCSITTDVDVTVTVTPAPTVPAPTQEFCNAGTVADLVATGTAIKWYAASTGGTALATTTALVNGTIYYASQTVGGCESVTRTARTATINVVAAPTVANTAQTFCNAGTVADLLPNDASIKWYAAATGGTALVSTTALVSGNSYYASQTVNGCESIPRTAVTATNIAPAAPTVANTAQTFCNAGTVADLLPNDTSIKWYAASTGGTALLSTDALVSGSHYFASQTVNGCEGIARTDVTVTITVIPAPVINDTDQVFCNAATVADLLPNDASIKWYADATGGAALASTDALVSGTPYFASQTIDGCEGLVRTEVAVTINVTPVPTGDDEQEFCTAAIIDDLVADGNAIVWYDAETGGTAYIGSTALVDGTVYYASQTIDGCESATRLGVTAVIHTVVADAPADVNVCTEYVLPALTSGAYFTESGGQGIELAAGSVINDTTTLYVYAEDGTDVICSDENSFTVTVANVQAPTGDDTQTIEGNVASDATVSDLQTDTTTGTVTWYASEEDALAGENALSGDTQLVQGATYYATLTVGTCTSEDVFAVTVDIVLDREAFDVKAFTYHPNPVKDVLNLSYSSEITSVTVFNLLGQRVIAQLSNATDVKVDMSSLADGAYVVNVTSGNTVKTIKVIKKQ